MAEYCGDCAKLQINGSCCWGDEYYCEETRRYTSKNKEACSSFIKRPDGGYKRAGFSFWYIVSKVCSMLDIDYESDFYKNLFSLRSYMEETEEGLAFLDEYDEIGPMIAAKISRTDLQFANCIYTNVLVPCEQLIKEGKFDEATTLYQEMVGVLKVRFGLIGFEVIPKEPISESKLNQTLTRTNPKLSK